MSIKIPAETLQKESFKSLPAKGKEEYLNSLLIKIINLNPEGVTTSQIKEATGIASSTIWHHLEILSHTAQVDKVSRGNSDIYIPCGSESHLNDCSSGDDTYSVSIVKNSKGTFACIHQKIESGTGSLMVHRGIPIPIGIIDKIINSLNKAKKSAE